MLQKITTTTKNSGVKRWKEDWIWLLTLSMERPSLNLSFPNYSIHVVVNMSTQPLRVFKDSSNIMHVTMISKF